MRSTTSTLLRILILIPACVGCGDTTSDDVGDDDDEVPLVPGSYADSFVEIGRFTKTHPLPIWQNKTTVTEMAARNTGQLIAYCSANASAVVVDATDPTVLREHSDPKSSIENVKAGRCNHLTWGGLNREILYFSSVAELNQPIAFISAFDYTAATPPGVSPVVPPVEKFSFQLPIDSPEGLASVGTMLYVASPNGGLIVYEDTGATLVERGRLGGLGSPWGITAIGTTLYIADMAGSLSIVDVTTAAAPSLVGRVTIDGSPRSVVIDNSNHLAYVAAGTGGLVTVDIANPATPSIANIQDTPGSATQVAIGGETLYLADWDDVRVFDLTTPAAPVLATTEHFSIPTRDFTRVRGVATLGSTVFLGEWTTALFAYRYAPLPISAPDIRVGLNRVLFGKTEFGESSAEAVLIHNDGSEPLALYSIRSSDPAITVSKTQLLIPPGESASLDVTFSPTVTTATINSVTLTSDDPDEALIVLPVFGNNGAIVPGDLPPAMSADLITGTPWSLEDELGKIVVIVYFASWCVDCQTEFPQVESQIQAQFQNQNVKVIGISSPVPGFPAVDTLTSIHQFIDPLAVTFDVGIETGIPSQPVFRAGRPRPIAALPLNIVIDREGYVSYVSIEEGIPGLVAAIQAAL